MLLLLKIINARILLYYDNKLKRYFKKILKKIISAIEK
ncbi:hypothetical protein RICGR_0294 [Rickettsiella grylli]|uniref:Uncharacterized protein n=1 Tax=Rickettsiella grylli TaxID=59196 RepID=A8PKC1_9COXI|nr:hypothetical protein RICGR_0294 [Rickettsiella grylli]